MARSVLVVLCLCLAASVWVDAQTPLEFLGTPAARRPRTSLELLKGVVNSLVLSAGSPADGQAVQTFLSGGAAPGPKAAPGQGHNSGHQRVVPADAPAEAPADVLAVAPADAPTAPAVKEATTADIKTTRERRDTPPPATDGVLKHIVQGVKNYYHSVAAAVSGAPNPNATADTRAANATADTRAANATADTRAANATADTRAANVTSAVKSGGKSTEKPSDTPSEKSSITSSDTSSERSSEKHIHNSNGNSSAGPGGGQANEKLGGKAKRSVPDSKPAGDATAAQVSDKNNKSTVSASQSNNNSTVSASQSNNNNINSSVSESQTNSNNSSVSQTNNNSGTSASQTNNNSSTSASQTNNNTTEQSPKQSVEQVEMTTANATGHLKGQQARGTHEEAQQVKQNNNSKQRKKRSAPGAVTANKDALKDAPFVTRKDANVLKELRGREQQQSAPQEKQEKHPSNKKTTEKATEKEQRLKREEKDVHKTSNKQTGNTKNNTAVQEDRATVKELAAAETTKKGNDKAAEKSGGILKQGNKQEENKKTRGKRYADKEKKDEKISEEKKSKSEEDGVKSKDKKERVNSKDVKQKKAAHEDGEHLEQHGKPTAKQVATAARPHPRHTAGKPRGKQRRSVLLSGQMGLKPAMEGVAQGVVVSPEVLKSVGADVFKVHHHWPLAKAGHAAATKGAPSGAVGSAGARFRRAIRELKPHELPAPKRNDTKPRKQQGVGQGVGQGVRQGAGQSVGQGAGRGAGQSAGQGRGQPESVGGSVINIKHNPNVRTEVRTLKDGSQVVVKREERGPRQTPGKQAERRDPQPSAVDNIETLKPAKDKAGGQNKKYEILPGTIPKGVTVRGTATFVKALKVIDQETKVRRRRGVYRSHGTHARIRVDQVDGKLKLPPAPSKGAKGSKEARPAVKRPRREAPTPTRATPANLTDSKTDSRQDEEGTVKIYGTLESEMVKVKGYIQGDLTGAASAYVVPTLLSRYGDFVQGHRNGEFFNDNGVQGGQRGEVGFYGSAAQRQASGLNQQAQFADNQNHVQGQRRDNGYYGNTAGVKSGHDVGRNFDTGQAFDKKGASGTYQDKEGKHKKGFKNAGFRNTYHKDESANTTSFFDDLNDEGGHKQFDQSGASYLDQGANKNRGDFLNTAFAQDGNGKQGGYDGGTAYKDMRGQAGNAANNNNFDDRAKFDYQHQGNNHGGARTEGGKFFNGGGAQNQAGATGGGVPVPGHSFHGALPTGGGGGCGSCGGGGGFETVGGGGGFGSSSGSSFGANGGSSFGSGSSGSFGSNGGGSFGSSGGGGSFGSNGGGSFGSNGGGSFGSSGGGGNFGSNGGGSFGSGGTGLGFNSRVMTSAGLYDPSSAVRNSNPYPYYPPPSPVPLNGGGGNGVLDLRGGTFYQGGGYSNPPAAQFIPEPVLLGAAPLNPMFSPSQRSQTRTTAGVSGATPNAYHRFSKSSFRIGAEENTGPSQPPDGVRGKGFATWETFGNSAAATALRYKVLAMPH